LDRRTVLIRLDIEEVHAVKDITKDYRKCTGERPKDHLITVLLTVSRKGKITKQHFVLWRQEWKKAKVAGAFYTRKGVYKLARRKLYITYLRKNNPEVFYVEGSYDEAFKEVILKRVKAAWEPENRRWRVQKEHLHTIKQEAAVFYDCVLYSEGGDFVEL